MNAGKATNARNTWCRAHLDPDEANPEMGKQRYSPNAQMRSVDNRGTKYKYSTSDLGSHGRNRDKVNRQGATAASRDAVTRTKRLNWSKETPAQNPERDPAPQEDF